MRIVLLGAVVIVMGLATPAAAEGPLELFFPLVARRPVIEREVEMRTVHEARRNGRETVVALGIEWPILPRWGVSLTIPLAFSEPRAGATTAGIGDIELESKMIIAAPSDRSALVTAGLALKLPAGSERRGLGGDTALEPFAAVGLVAGDVLIVADAGYVVTLAGRDRDRRRIHGTVAVGRPLGQRFLPLLALTAANTLEDGNRRDADGRGRMELYVTAGINVRVSARTTLGLGVQLPLTRTRALDHAVFVTIDRDL